MGDKSPSHQTDKNKAKHQAGKRENLFKVVWFMQDLDLVVVEDLECVDEDGLDHAYLPAGVCDVAAGIGAHEGWSIHNVSRV